MGEICVPSLIVINSTSDKYTSLQYYITTYKLCTIYSAPLLRGICPKFTISDLQLAGNTLGADSSDLGTKVVVLGHLYRGSRVPYPEVVVSVTFPFAWGFVK